MSSKLSPKSGHHHPHHPRRGETRLLRQDSSVVTQSSLLDLPSTDLKSAHPTTTTHWICYMLLRTTPLMFEDSCLVLPLLSSSSHPSSLGLAFPRLWKIIVVEYTSTSCIRHLQNPTNWLSAWEALLSKQSKGLWRELNQGIAQLCPRAGLKAGMGASFPVPDLYQSHFLIRRIRNPRPRRFLPGCLYTS